jgi:hypothetical protein
MDWYCERCATRATLKRIAVSKSLGKLPRYRWFCEECEARLYKLSPLPGFDNEPKYVRIDPRNHE